ncbi:MAG: response regulator, partial [Dehalococcoidia bacterium]
MTSGTGARVLVVEDDPGILRALNTNLTRHGFDVETAETGAEALDAYARRRPDLILLDLGLPDIDGTVVIQEVRARANTPIVVLSV